MNKLYNKIVQLFSHAFYLIHNESMQINRRSNHLSRFIGCSTQGHIRWQHSQNQIKNIFLVLFSINDSIYIYLNFTLVKWE